MMGGGMGGGMTGGTVIEFSPLLPWAVLIPLFVLAAAGVLERLGQAGAQYRGPLEALSNARMEASADAGLESSKGSHERVSERDQPGQPPAEGAAATPAQTVFYRRSRFATRLPVDDRVDSK